ncbi:hypothetical protein [Erythrobacter alti]|uniref:hypothetical protein n=1 Tax=Erythrobacter alti TaxID=1896145 RepID=UPI0030F3B948
MPGEGAQPIIAGKSIAQRQLLFARECGCTMVIAHGGGASSDAISLRQAVEGAGLRYQAISNSHALAGAIGGEDSLLVLQPGLLPESRQALDLLRADGDRLLVTSAGPGAAAGFERIDLDRAWGGAVTMPGRWLEALTSLPEDAAPHAALLRIALQKRLPEARLADSILDDGRWMLICDAQTAELREKHWMRDQLGAPSNGAVSRTVARFAVSRTGSWLMARKWARPVLLAVTAIVLGGSVAAAIYDQPVAAFGLAALAVPLLESFLSLSRLAVAPFGRIARLPWLRRAIDAVLLVIAFLAIDSLWYRAAFPAFVLVAGLLLLDRRAVRGIVETLRDRAVVAATIGVVAAIFSPEVAIMSVVALLLAVKLAPDAKDSG